MADTRRIKKAQIDADVKNIDIAREYGCSEAFVSQVISGHRRSRKLERFIARKLNARVEELFPRECQGEAA